MFNKYIYKKKKEKINVYHRLVYHIFLLVNSIKVFDTVYHLLNNQSSPLPVTVLSRLSPDMKNKKSYLQKKDKQSKYNNLFGLYL